MYKFLVFFITCFLLIRVATAADPSSCSSITWEAGEKYQDYYQKIARETCLREWTVLIYMQADNDLTPYAFWDLYEMESAFKRKLNASTKRTDVLVQLDTKKSNKVSRLHMFQSKKPYQQLELEDFKQTTLKNIYSPIINQFDEAKMSAKQKDHFQDFVAWGKKQYPAKNYMVIIWGHGQGWAKNNAVQFGGVASDDTQKTKLSIPDIRESLENNNVDVLATDACLMQTVEVVYELSDVADYIIGSTQVQNFLGLPYRRMFYEMNTGHYLGLRKDNKNLKLPYVLAKMLPQLFKKSFDSSRGLQGRIDPDAIKQLTMSSFNTAELKRYLMPELKQLGEELYQYLDENPFSKVALKDVVENMPRFLGGSRDLGTFIGKLEADFNYRNLRVYNALIRSVVAYAYGSDYLGYTDGLDYFAGYFKALGIWLPTSKDNYQLLKESFFETQFYKDTGWGNWIDKLYQKPVFKPNFNQLNF